MLSPIKALVTLATSLAAGLLHRSAQVMLTVILLASNALPQSETERLGMSANELARRVVANEWKLQDADHSH